jgi:glutaredoxin
MLIAVAIICLAIAESTGGLPFSMPASWYVNRSVWYLVAVACFWGGWVLLRTASTTVQQLHNAEDGVRFERVILYTKEDCHLCNVAAETLAKYSRYLPEPEQVDIASDATLVERFGTQVPVVEIDGTIRFRGRVNDVLLERLIVGTPPKSHS